MGASGSPFRVVRRRLPPGRLGAAARTAGWTLIGDELTIEDVWAPAGVVHIRAVFGGGPWTRIG